MNNNQIELNEFVQCLCEKKNLRIVSSGTTEIGVWWEIMNDFTKRGIRMTATDELILTKGLPGSCEYLTKHIDKWLAMIPVKKDLL